MQVSHHSLMQAVAGGGMKQTGETLQLTCTVSGFSVDSFGVHCISQSPGKGWKWVGLIQGNGKTYYNNTFQNWISITREIARNQVFLFLQLNSLKAAMHCCSRDAPTLSKFL